MTGPTAAAVARFAADLAALDPPGGPLGLAVSGGADSLALLLLTHAVRGSSVRVATVDHGLRPEAADEAARVATLCASLGVGHDALTVRWDMPPTSNIQERARDARYALLEGWAIGMGAAAVLTGHHADDQAETLLMRLARGSGVSGLAGVRSRSRLPGGTPLLRPLLGWRRAELSEIVASAGLEPIDDPSNCDPRFDRSRMRAMLAAQEWADPLRIAASASHLADAEEALRQVAYQLAESRIAGAVVDPSGLPRELRRRLLVAALCTFGAEAPRGADVERLLATLDAGGTATLGGVKAQGGPTWRLSHAAPHRK